MFWLGVRLCLRKRYACAVERKQLAREGDCLRPEDSYPWCWGERDTCIMERNGKRRWVLRSEDCYPWLRKWNKAPSCNVEILCYPLHVISSSWYRHSWPSSGDHFRLGRGMGMGHLLFMQFLHEVLRRITNGKSDCASIKTRDSFRASTLYWYCKFLRETPLMANLWITKA